MNENDLKKYLQIVKRDAVRFEPVFPPNHQKVVTTFFGGSPLLPQTIPWPETLIEFYKYKPDGFVKRTPDGEIETYEKKVASTFIGQIDLEGLPPNLNLDLPNKGTLYFFADTAIEDMQFTGEPGNGGRVIYWEGSSKEIPARKKPENLWPCYGEDWHYYYKWLENLQPYGFTPPKSFTKFEVQAIPHNAYDLRYTGPRAWYQKEAESKPEALERSKIWDFVSKVGGYANENLQEILKSKRSEEFYKSKSPTVPRNFFVGDEDDPGWQGNQLKWRGTEGFPYTMVEIEIFCGMLLNEIKERRTKRSSFSHKVSSLNYQFNSKGIFSFETMNAATEVAVEFMKHLYNQPLRASFFKKLNKVEEQISVWLNLVKEEGRFSVVPENLRNQFLSWYDDMIEGSNEKMSDPRSWYSLYRCLREAFIIGPRLSLSHSPESAALIPEVWRENQRWQWATSNYDNSAHSHYLLGDYSDYPTSITPDLVPLMTFNTQDCFSWMWGDVVTLIFMININDLKQGDFSKAYVVLGPE